MISSPITTTRSRYKFLGFLSLGLLVFPWASFAFVGELAVAGVLAVLAMISNRLIVIAAEFASMALDSKQFFGQGFLDASIVQLGWNFVLSITNGLFIFALLVIGFATIFRKSGYGMKDILWKLIVAALLVNFSLVIAGVFIDASNVAAEYFIQGTGDKNFGGVVVSRMGITPGGMPDPNAKPPDPGWLPSWQVIQAFIIQGIFNLIAAFILLLVGIMFVIRTIMLWILLILSPIVWLAWVLPSTEQHWSRWWKEFFTWCFFAPTATFFLFLAMSLGKVTNAVLESGTAPDALTPGYFSAAGIANFLIITGLMVASLVVASKSAGIGGDMVKSLAGWGAGMIKGAGMKFSGLNMANRYRKGIAKEFGGTEQEKQAIVNDRVKRAKGALVEGIDKAGTKLPFGGVRGLGDIARRPKEVLKARAERAEALSHSIVKGFREGKKGYSFDDIRGTSGGWRRFSPLGANRDTAAAYALAMAQLEKEGGMRDVEVEEEWTKPTGQYEDPITKSRDLRVQGQKYKVTKKEPIIKLTDEEKFRAGRANQKLAKMKGEKSDADKLVELQIKMAKEKIKEEEAGKTGGGKKPESGEKEGGSKKP